MLSTDEKLARLALLLTHAFSRQQFYDLIQRLGSAQLVLQQKSLLQNQLAEKQRIAISTPAWEAAEQQLSWQERNPQQHHLFFWDDADFPAQLKRIDDPPLVLWVRGQASCLTDPQIAVVGSRNATLGGEKIAYDFANNLAENGLIITSGLAGGIDTAAHQGTLQTNHGQTIAVLGTGVDIAYPARNKKLAEHILERGAVVSELPLGSRAQAWHFPQRNRIISGLSLGVLVVEAAENSGSLITARMAIEQGREVFAIPGSIHNPLAKGCHQLIKQGQAKLTETTQDILSELSHQLRPYTLSSHTNDHPLAISDAANQLLQIIPFDPIDADLLLQKAKIDAATLSALLLELELSDSVEIYGGNRIARISSSR